MHFGGKILYFDIFFRKMNMGGGWGGYEDFCGYFWGYHILDYFKVFF